MLCVQVDLVLCTIQRKADRALSLAAIDVIDEQRLYLLGHVCSVSLVELCTRLDDRPAISTTRGRMLRMRVLGAPSSRRVRAIGRSNHRYSGASLKPTARPNSTTRTPVDVIPVTFVTRRRARPDHCITRPASHPAPTRTLVHYSCVSRTHDRTAASAASTWRLQATMVDVRQDPASVTRRRRLGAVGLKCTCIPGSIDSLSLNENECLLLVVSSLACHH